MARWRPPDEAKPTRWIALPLLVAIELARLYRDVWRSIPRWGRGLYLAAGWLLFIGLIADWLYLGPLAEAEEAAHSHQRELLPLARVMGREQDWEAARPWTLAVAIAGVALLAAWAFPQPAGNLIRLSGRGFRAMSAGMLSLVNEWRRDAFAARSWLVRNWRDD
jgi:hypothetical protein